MLKSNAQLLPILLLVVTGCACALPHAPATVSSNYEGGFSYEQLSSLAREVLAQTPEHTHFAKETKFEWVCFRPAREGDLFPRFTELVRHELRDKYAVYSTETEIPASFVGHDAVATSYRSGFLFSVALRKIQSDRVEIEYQDYEASLAAGHRIIEYFWSDGRWQQTGVRDDWVS
jgi:hypothetical protein